jgi:hypothetical protein
MSLKTIFFLFIFLLPCVNIVCAQPAEKNYYIVIGTFPKLVDAQFVWDSKKQRYFVLLLQTPDQEKAKSFLKRIRKETEYKKARLYQGNLGETP